MNLQNPFRKRWAVKHWDDRNPNITRLLSKKFLFKRNAIKAADQTRMVAHYGMLHFTKQYEVERIVE